MTGLSAHVRRLARMRHGLALAAALLAATGMGGAQAQDRPAPVKSALNHELFLKLLIGEIELREGQVGNAYERYLDAARSTGDEGLYQRAVEIALQARAGEQALAAARAWRAARPKSIDALRYETQILLALNRLPDMAEPLSAWLANAPVVERPGLIAAIPRLLQRAVDRKEALALVTRVVEPYRSRPATRVAALLAVARASFAAGDAAAALALAREAQAADPDAPGPALLALDMQPGGAEVERLITDHLARPGAQAAVRLGYIRLLTQSQRYADAVTQLEHLTREKPDLPDPWLSLGALHLELKQPQQAEAALQHYLDLANRPAEAGGTAATPPAAPASAPAKPHDVDEDETGAAGQPARDLTQAWLLLAQAAEQRGDTKAAEAWLARIDNPQRALEVQSRRASLMARQGQWREARALIRAVPEQGPDDARAKLLAEAQLMREHKRWRDAAEVLAAANQRFPDDVDLLYEQAMAEEKIDHFAEMERLLRRVIELRPTHPHAHNALGYSLADRNQRLPEARELIRKALELAPGDPFITDSLGWVEFRLGNLDESARLLREAYRARPDTEIAAHLGEVLWSMGQHDEARRVWQQAHARDADNEVLRDTLRRLRIRL